VIAVITEKAKILHQTVVFLSLNFIDFLGEKQTKIRELFKGK